MEKAARIECIELSHGLLVIATADGRSWLTTLGDARTVPLPASAIAVHRASSAAAAIEGAIYAGLTYAAHPAPNSDRQSVAAGDSALSGRVSGLQRRAPASARHTLLRYVKWLAGNAVFAAQTPALFREAAQRFDGAGRVDLARFANQKAAEEDGHAALALADLAALGLPAQAVVEALQPPSATAFALRFAELVRSDAPVALFGFSYCLERMALQRDADFVRTVTGALPANVRAQRFLSVHSAIGSDHAHVDEQLALFEAMTPADLHLVVRATFDTARMLKLQPRSDRALTANEIARRLRGCIGLHQAEPSSLAQAIWAHRHHGGPSRSGLSRAASTPAHPD